MATTNYYGTNDQTAGNDDNYDEYEFDDTFDDVDAETTAPALPSKTTEPDDAAVENVPTENNTGTNGATDVQPETAQPKTKKKRMRRKQPTEVVIDKQPAPTGKLAWGGFGFCVFALTCLLISFCSPYWIQTWPMSLNEFHNMGLWHVCFSDYMHFKDDSQQVYSGCWWVYDMAPMYYKLREWLIPPWFITCQVLVSGCLVVEISTTLVIGLIFLHCCPVMNHEYLQTYGMFASASMMFLVSMITLCVGILYGVQVNDRYWLPRPDQNYLSWGFGFLIISGIFTTFSGLCLFAAAWDTYNILLSKEDEYTKMALEMSMYPMDQSTFPLIPTDEEMEYADGEQPYPTVVEQSYGPSVVPMGFMHERPPTYTPRQASYGHEVSPPPVATTVSTSSYSAQPNREREVTPAVTSSSSDVPFKHTSSVSFEPESVIYGKRDSYDQHDNSTVFAKSFEQQPTGPYGPSRFGKSYEKSYERRLSNTSFDDPELDEFDPKPERQY